MLIRRGTCGTCGAGFTAYDGECLVVRLDPLTPKNTCKAEILRDGQCCPILRSTTARAPCESEQAKSVRLTEHDRRVFAVLTADFATPTQIAIKAKLPTRTRAQLAEQICNRLAHYGLAEFANTRTQRIWRLRNTR